LLLNYAAEIRGTSPARFSFRSVSPLFDNDPFWLNAEENGEALKLWTARQNGRLAMTAEAEWT
jgi:3-methylfumaryl-CoA hydratase